MWGYIYTFGGMRTIECLGQVEKVLYLIAEFATWSAASRYIYTIK